jgi:hypothetical protein
VTISALDDPYGVLRRVLRPRERPAPGERCDMCGEPIAERHSHVADIGDRRLMCTCRGCYLLFTAPGAGGLRMRAVPENYRRVEPLAFSQQQWDELAIPVDLVFLFRQSESDGSTNLVVSYPSPAGATESESEAVSWDAFVAANPALTDVLVDVEAVLVRRLAPGEFGCYVVPIDACYHLVGIVRAHWVGFGGGSDVWEQIDEFFAELESRTA